MSSMIVVAASVGGCGGSSLDELQAASQAIVKECGWDSAAEVSQARMREEFVDREEGNLRLLLSASHVRARQTLVVAVANDTDDWQTHGLFWRIEGADGDPVYEPKGVPLLGLSVAAGAVGRCVPLPVPANADPGGYVAVLEGVNESDDAGSDEGTDLRAEFEITD